MDVAYLQLVGDMGGYYYELLNPTGRWKIVSGPYDNKELYIEHKAFFFKYWYHSSNVVFKAARTESVFNCRRGDGL